MEKLDWTCLLMLYCCEIQYWLSVESLHCRDFPGMRECEVNVVQTKALTWNAWEA